VSLTLEDEINQRRDERDRHKREIAYVIEQHLELENEDIAKNFQRWLLPDSTVTGSGELIARF